MNRRGFLKGILAAGVAPYVVTTSGLLMPVRQILVPDFWLLTSIGRIGMNVSNPVYEATKAFTVYGIEERLGSNYGLQKRFSELWGFHSGLTMCPSDSFQVDFSRA